MSQTTDDFFANAPQDYEVPKSDSQYMNFKAPGRYKFRILAQPIFGWEGWKTIDGKNTPFRFRMNEKPADTSSFKEGKVTHFWAMPVYNFNTNRVEVLSITQKGIQAAIEAYARDVEWGSPLRYNLTVTREGTGREDTKYTTLNSPHSPLADEAKAAWERTQAAGFNINELFKDGDPFAPTTPAPQAAETAPTPAPEKMEGAEVGNAAAAAPADTQEAPEITQPVDAAVPPN